jgi:regulator of cell morphogenesis and NO signaling
MKDEEQIIFPHIRQTANDIKYAEINDTSISQSLKEKIKLLQNEHAKAFTYLRALRQVTNNFGIPFDACNSYKALFEKMRALEDDLYIHFHLEDDILFPTAIAAYRV